MKSRSASSKPVVPPPAAAPPSPILDTRFGKAIEPGYRGATEAREYTFEEIARMAEEPAPRVDAVDDLSDRSDTTPPEATTTAKKPARKRAAPRAAPDPASALDRHDPAAIVGVSAEEVAKPAVISPDPAEGSIPGQPTRLQGAAVKVLIDGEVVAAFDAEIEIPDEERALAAADENDDCELPPVLKPHSKAGGMPEGVSVVRREGRALETISATHGIWTSPAKHWSAKGKLLRLYPPADAEDSKIEEVAAKLRASGAEGVKVMPRPARAAVSRPGDEEPAVGPPRPMREVVMGFAERVTPEQRPAVVELLSRAMDKGEQAAAKEGVLVPLPGAPLFVESLMLTNWLRYEGSHDIDLEPTIYGVTATQLGDPERSNWQGKSSILEAIAFALYGWHRWPTEDAWITRGQKEGGVTVLLSDGTLITRSRKKSTQLAVTPRRGKELNAEHAQAEIDRRIGLSEEDFFATCFFKQKDLARLIKAKPGERLEIVRGWLALAPVVHAEEWVRGEIGAIALKLERATNEAARLTQAIGKLSLPFDAPGGGPDWDGWIAAESASEAEANEHARQVEADAAAVKAANDGLARWEQDAAAARRHAGLVQDWDREVARRPMLAAELARLKDGQIAELKKQASRDHTGPIKARLPLLVEAEATTRGVLRDAEREVAQKKSLAAGDFDGVCPVAKIECPATAKINAARVPNRKLFTVAQAAEDAARKNYSDAAEQVRGVRRSIEESAAIDGEVARWAAEVTRYEGTIREHEAKIAAIDKEIGALAPAVDRIAKDGQPVRQPAIDTRPAWEAARSAASRTAAAKRAKADNDRLIEEQKTAADERALYEQVIAVHRQAIAILGKGGAQKAIAASELQAIEQATNAMLAGAGVDLSIVIRWGNPSTTTLQASCDGCGHVYVGAKQKSCPRCDAVRGPKLDDKLEVELSDRSGAAEDLAGIALQLAASAWLRARRGAAWAMVAIDEPFGALDVANGKALAVHLAGMLSRGAFRQGFVIAHTPAAMDALPSRLQVTGTAGREGRSTVEVLR